ncbi:hypothetical protein Q4595_22815, partial [Wenyingzhuangia sp. 1_MG-2023]|nr:hypothetical protein [Wenyingzhuangia sp. 1_MG-2023]
AQAAGGTLDQSHTKTLFELGYFAADSGLGQSEIFSGTGEAASVHNMDKNRHFIEVKFFALANLH